MIGKLVASAVYGGTLFAFAAQAQTPDTVIAGPFGVPRLVRTEGGQWSEPIKVFSDATQVVYIPDITTPAWAQWHAQEFKERNLYFTYVYTYLRKQRTTVQELIHVNTQTQRIVVERFLKPPLTLDARTGPPSVAKTVAAITKIVNDCIANFHSPTVQEFARQQDRAVAQMAAQLDQGGPKVYATNVPRLITVPSPKYPQEDWDAHVSGVVTVGMTVEPDGTAADVHIVKSVSPTLDAAALQAVQLARFEPAHNDVTGAATSSAATLDFNFPAH